MDRKHDLDIHGGSFFVLAMNYMLKRLASFNRLGLVLTEGAETKGYFLRI